MSQTNWAWTWSPEIQIHWYGGQSGHGHRIFFKFLWETWGKNLCLRCYSWFLPLGLLLMQSCQSCPTLCDPIDGSPPGSPIPGILQARILVWVTISFSHAWKWKAKVKSLSHVRLLATPWTVAHQAPPSMGFSRQGYWSGVPLPSPTEFMRLTTQKELFHLGDYIKCVF